MFLAAQIFPKVFLGKTLISFGTPKKLLGVPKVFLGMFLVAQIFPKESLGMFLVLFGIPNKLLGTPNKTLGIILATLIFLLNAPIIVGVIKNVVKELLVLFLATEMVACICYCKIGGIKNNKKYAKKSIAIVEKMR